jgi:heme exporter protein CcmD
MADHTGFIVSAYGFALLVVVVMVAAILSDYNRQRRALAQLNADQEP